MPFSTSMVLSVEFIFGENIAIQGHLNTGVRGRTDFLPASFLASMDASHSLVWQGISKLTDSRGQVVTGCTLTSDSGTDWSRHLASPVPEPGTALLALGGVLALGLTRAHRLRLC